MEGRAWRTGGFGVHGPMLFRRFRSGGRRRGAGAFRRFRSGGRRRGVPEVSERRAPPGGFGGFGAPGGGAPPKPRKTSGRAPAGRGETGEPPGGAGRGETGGTPGGGRNGETGESAWGHARRNRRVSRRAPEWRNRRNGNVVSDSNVSSVPPAIASLLARMAWRTLDDARRRWPQWNCRTAPTPPDAVGHNETRQLLTAARHRWP